MRPHFECDSFVCRNRKWTNIAWCRVLSTPVAAAVNSIRCCAPGRMSNSFAYSANYKNIFVKYRKSIVVGF